MRIALLAITLLTGTPHGTPAAEPTSEPTSSAPSAPAGPAAGAAAHLAAGNVQLAADLAARSLAEAGPFAAEPITDAVSPAELTLWIFAEAGRPGPILDVARNLEAVGEAYGPDTYERVLYLQSASSAYALAAAAGHVPAAAEADRLLIATTEAARALTPPDEAEEADPAADIELSMALSDATFPALRAGRPELAAPLLDRMTLPQQLRIMAFAAEQPPETTVEPNPGAAGPHPHPGTHRPDFATPAVAAALLARSEGLFSEQAHPDPAATRVMAGWYLQVGRTQDALRLIRTLDDNETSLSLAVDGYGLALAEGRPADAAAMLEVLQPRLADDPDGTVAEAVAQGLLLRGQAEAALPYAARAADRLGNLPAHERTSRALDVGDLLVRLGKVERGLTLFDRAAAEPHAFPDHGMLCQALVEAGRPDEAVARAARLPEDERQFAWMWLVRSLAEAGDLERARAVFDDQPEVTSPMIVPYVARVMAQAMSRAATTPAERHALDTWIARLESPLDRAWAWLGAAEGQMPGPPPGFRIYFGWLE